MWVAFVACTLFLLDSSGLGISREKKGRAVYDFFTTCISQNFAFYSSCILLPFAGGLSCLPLLTRTHHIIAYLVFPSHDCSAIFVVFMLLTVVPRIFVHHLIISLGEWF